MLARGEGSLGKRGKSGFVVFSKSGVAGTDFLEKVIFGQRVEGGEGRGK